MDAIQQRTALEREIVQRLKTVCQDWPEELFTELVRSIATLSLKYDHANVSGSVAYDRRTTERLIEDMKTIVQRSVDARGDDPGAARSP